MLTHPTLDQLRALKLDGMVQAFVELEAQEEARNLAHAEWLALLLDREAADRNTRRFQTRLRGARVVEDRHGRGSMLITSQLPVTTWHEVIGEPTLGDAILDRIVHNAYRLELDGPSMRKIKASEATEPERRPWRRPQPMASRPREQRNEAQTQRPGRPRGSTGTSRARRCVSRGGTPRRARVPPVDYGDGLQCPGPGREEVWRCVQSGEVPHLINAEAPRPRIEAIRIVDMASSNS